MEETPDVVTEDCQSIPPAELSLEASEQKESSPKSTQLSQDRLSDSGTDEVSKSAAAPPEPVDIKVLYNKKKYDMTVDSNQTILELKKDIEKLTGKVKWTNQGVLFIRHATIYNSVDIFSRRTYCYSKGDVQRWVWRENEC